MTTPLADPQTSAYQHLLNKLADLGLPAQDVLLYLSTPRRNLMDEHNSSGLLIDEIRRLQANNDRLRQDRKDALSVTSSDKLTVSEWVARTGQAERERALALGYLDTIIAAYNDDGIMPLVNACRAAKEWRTANTPKRG